MASKLGWGGLIGGAIGYFLGSDDEKKPEEVNDSADKLRRAAMLAQSQVIPATSKIKPAAFDSKKDLTLGFKAPDLFLNDVGLNSDLRRIIMSPSRIITDVRIRPAESLTVPDSTNPNFVRIINENFRKNSEKINEIVDTIQKKTQELRLLETNILEKQQTSFERITQYNKDIFAKVDQNIDNVARDVYGIQQVLKITDVDIESLRNEIDALQAQLENQQIANRTHSLGGFAGSGDFGGSGSGGLLSGLSNILTGIGLGSMAPARMPLLPSVGAIGLAGAATALIGSLSDDEELVQLGSIDAIRQRWASQGFSPIHRQLFGGPWTDPKARAQSEVWLKRAEAARGKTWKVEPKAPNKAQSSESLLGRFGSIEDFKKPYTPNTSAGIPGLSLLPDSFRTPYRIKGNPGIPGVPGTVSADSLGFGGTGDEHFINWITGPSPMFRTPPYGPGSWSNQTGSFNTGGGGGFSGSRGSGGNGGYDSTSAGTGGWLPTNSAGNVNTRGMSREGFNSPDTIIVKAASGDPNVTSTMIDDALKTRGMHERRDRDTIRQYLKEGGVKMDPATTKWCAAFVNSTLQQHGIKGTQSGMASSFLRWGQGVSWKDGPQKGDIFAREGHVGMFTGNVKDGRYEMLGGNQGHLPEESKGSSTIVSTQWIRPGQYAIRRAILDPNANLQTSGPIDKPPVTSANKVMDEVMQRFGGKPGAQLPKQPGGSREFRDISSYGIDQSLGGVTQKYESGSKGVFAYSNARGDPGGPSYGAHQLSAGGGSLGGYLNDKRFTKYTETLRGLRPGSAAFNAEYMRIASADPEGFAASQKAYYVDKNYSDKRIHAEKLGFNLNDKGVQEALFSGSVQHGRMKEVISDAARRIGDVKNASPEEQINALYDARTDYVAHGKGGAKLGAGVKRSVLNRFKQERKDVLQYAGQSAVPDGRQTEIPIQDNQGQQSIRSDRQPDSLTFSDKMYNMGYRLWEAGLNPGFQKKENIIHKPPELPAEPIPGVKLGVNIGIPKFLNEIPSWNESHPPDTGYVPKAKIQGLPPDFDPNQPGWKGELSKDGSWQRVGKSWVPVKGYRPAQPEDKGRLGIGAGMAKILGPYPGRVKPAFQEHVTTPPSPVMRGEGGGTMPTQHKPTTKVKPPPKPPVQETVKQFKKGDEAEAARAARGGAYAGGGISSNKPAVQARDADNKGKDTISARRDKEDETQIRPPFNQSGADNNPPAPGDSGTGDAMRQVCFV